MTRLNLMDARCEALFASGLQGSERPNTEAAAEAISRAVRQFGIRGCASRMAQEFGDHPEAAAERMRWVRLVVAEITARPRQALAPHGQCPAPARLAARRPGLSGLAVSAAMRHRNQPHRRSSGRAGHAAPHSTTRPGDRRQR